MNEKHIEKTVDGIDDRYIAEAADCGAEENNARPARSARGRKILFAGLAAALVLLIAAGVWGGAALISEAREYREAVAFFEENGLSTEGLSRAEIKEVYKDITLKRFDSDVTAEVIRQAVKGWEILQKEPSPEELSLAWSRFSAEHRNVQTVAGVGYRHVLTDTDKNILECVKNGETVWSITLPNMFYSGHAVTSSGLAVWGLTSYDYDVARLLCIDENGQILWRRDLRHDFKSEYIGAVVERNDGAWAVISRGNLGVLCFSVFDGDGNETYCKKTEIGNKGIGCAATLGDGYLVQLFENFGDYGYSTLAKLDKDGGIDGYLKYESKDCTYYITGMIEFEKQIYLSAYAVPGKFDLFNSHAEIVRILERFNSEEYSPFDVSGEELTPLVRENYTAVLLRCSGSGEISTFYEVKGSLGDRLTVTDGGLLCWTVHSIVSTLYSPATNSFSIGGVCSVFRYCFDASCDLISQEDTGETALFRR